MRTIGIVEADKAETEEEAVEIVEADKAEAKGKGKA